MTLIENIAVAVNSDFKVYLPLLFPQILQVFDSERAERQHAVLKALHALKVFGPNLEGYLHLVLPAVIRLIERSDFPLSIRKAGIQTLGQLCNKVNFSEHASRLIHPLSRIMSESSLVELRQVSIETLTAVAHQMGSNYALFMPMVNQLVIKHKIQYQKYDVMLSRLVNGGSSEPFVIPDPEEPYEIAATDAPVVDSSTASKKLPVNQTNLKRSWEASQRSTRDDWQEWIRRLSVELLKESPSHALRACSTLAGVYHPLARELFNAGFASCWTELYDQFQDELVKSLEIAITSPNIPPEVLQIILNLAEYMEHDDKSLPIDIKTLGAYAARCHAYAKALHYKETEFTGDQSAENIESLISINNQLQQPDAAVGILSYARQVQGSGLKEVWYEKLQRWDEALQAYEKRQKLEPLSLEVTLGRMRCLHALGEWQRLSTLASEQWDDQDDFRCKAIAPLAAGAAWGLARWDQMQNYVSIMEDVHPDSTFFKAILAINHTEYREARNLIRQTRELLDPELTALIGESYSRAYG